MDEVFAGFGPLLLSVKLATVTVFFLLILCTPLALWLAWTKSKAKPFIEAIIALPLVLPPTVLGFYLLILLSPKGAIGGFFYDLTGEALTFSFTGLVIASMVYSLPFVMQPLQNAFESVGKKSLEAAESLGANFLDSFISVIMPMASRGFLTAAVMGFAHTLGEFGVVLMVGGNIPGETRVISIAIFDHVETLNFATAHNLSAILLIFSVVILVIVYSLNRKGYRPV